MTAGGSDINLATLWIPVTADTSKVAGQVKQAGEEAHEHFKRSFNAEGLGNEIGVGLLAGLQKTGFGSQISGMFGGISLKALGVATAIGGIVVAADKLGTAFLHVGEKFEDINRQVMLYTGATGSALEDLKSHADNLVGSLDTSTKNLGADMAIMATRLHMEAGPALDMLTKHVEELGDRFGRINPDAFAGAMMRFGLSSEDADNALASFMQTAQNLGVSLPGIVETLSVSGATLKDLGLSAEEAGSLIGKLEALGPAGANGIEILQRAMKSAADQGKSLGDFLKDEAAFFAGPATAAAKDAEAADVFGARKAEEATDAVKALNEVIAEGPGKVQAVGTKIDETTEKTRTLENAWNKLYNTIDLKVKPAADWVVDQLTTSLERLDRLLAGNASLSLHGTQGAPQLPYRPGTPGLTPSTPGVPGTPGPPTVGGIPIPGLMPGHGGPAVGTGGVALRDFSTPMGGPDWQSIAGAESGGNWSITHGQGTPDNPVSGGLQIGDKTWADYGGLQYAPRAYMATPEQQIAVGAKVLAGQGPGAWPVTSRNHPDWFSGGGGGDGGGGGGLNLATIPVSVQKYANDCIDASARIILSHAGINMDEDQLEGVIAPGGTIQSQAAGLNKLYPQGGFVAMPGSGGSPQAMFNAIKASIDSGTGSILNVAPGSSIAGRPFGEGHFIAVTGYNADGTINLSDTASGTQYSVSAADAFQATSGRGIVAGTGTGLGPTPGGPGGSPYIPGTGETQQQARARQRALEDAQTRVSDADQRIEDLKEQAAEQSRKLAEDSRKLAGAGPGDRIKIQADIDKDNKELDQTIREYTKALQTQKRANEDLTDAQQKQYDESQKPAKGERGEGYGKTYSQAEQFGAGLLSGIMSDLGMGNVFGGKPPTEWGITKLLGGLAGWGLGTANAWGDLLSGDTQGKTVSVGGGLGGLSPGGLPGIKNLFPRGANPISGAPNIKPGGPLPPGAHPSHAGTVSYDNSINMGDVHTASPAAFTQHVQEQQNSRFHTVAGSLPAATTI